MTEGLSEHAHKKSLMTAGLSEHAHKKSLMTAGLSEHAHKKSPWQQACVNTLIGKC